MAAGCTEEGIEVFDWETLKDFGYFFNENGQLRNMITNEPFEFNVYKSKSANQRRYEKLGQVVEEHVYKLLEQEGGLLRATVPVEATNSEPNTFIFRSKDSFTCNKLLFLVHGSGVVRAGQWARRLIINHSLESGTQLPYIKKAKELGYGVLVLNTNYNSDKETGRPIRESSCPEEHFSYVWEHFVEKSKAEHIAIIAHSYGGAVTTRAAAQNLNITKKTFAVALTDSAHYRVKAVNRQEFIHWMRDNVRNWASSTKRLDTPLRADVGDCFTVSAGTTLHEETSWKAFDSVWKFIDRKWDRKWDTDSVNLTSDTTAATERYCDEGDDENWDVISNKRKTMCSTSAATDTATSTIDTLCGDGAVQLYATSATRTSTSSRSMDTKDDTSAVVHDSKRTPEKQKVRFRYSNVLKAKNSNKKVLVTDKCEAADEAPALGISKYVQSKNIELPRTQKGAPDESEQSKKAAEVKTVKLKVKKKKSYSQDIRALFSKISKPEKQKENDCTVNID